MALFSRHIFNTIFITAVGTGGTSSSPQWLLIRWRSTNFLVKTSSSERLFYPLMFVPTVTSISNYIILGRLGIIDRPLAG